MNVDWNEYEIMVSNRETDAWIPKRNIYKEEISL